MEAEAGGGGGGEREKARAQGGGGAGEERSGGGGSAGGARKQARRGARWPSRAWERKRGGESRKTEWGTGGAAEVSAAGRRAGWSASGGAGPLEGGVPAHTGA